MNTGKCKMMVGSSGGKMIINSVVSVGKECRQSVKCIVCK